MTIFFIDIVSVFFKSITFKKTCISFLQKNKKMINYFLFWFIEREMLKIILVGYFSENLFY